MSHDTSRHTERTTVTCSRCGRTLRAAADTRGRWHVLRHKNPEGKSCLGHLASDHRPVPPATT